MSRPDQVTNGNSQNLEITIACDEGGNCQTVQNPLGSTLESGRASSSSGPVCSSSTDSLYSEDPSLTTYSRPIGLTRQPTSVWHAYSSTNPREQLAARSLGRALTSWIEATEARNQTLDAKDQELIDPRLRGLANILQQGHLPTSDDIESNALFNQSYMNGALDVLIQSIASRVPNTDQTHRTALALSLPYNLERLDAESRRNVMAALVTDNQTRTILVESTRNTSPTLQSEIAQVLNNPTTRQAAVAAAAAQGAAIGAAGGLASTSRRDEVLRFAALSAVRAAEFANPPTALLFEGARWILPQVLNDPTGLPPFVESLLWSPSSGSPSPFSNPFPNVLPLTVRDLPGFSANENARDDGNFAGASAGSAAASMGEAIAHALSHGEEVSSPPPAPSAAPAPTSFQRVLDVLTHPDPVQSLLIGIASPLLFPAFSAAAALQGSGWLSQANVSPAATPVMGATLAFASVNPVTSSEGTHSDSDGSSDSHPGDGNPSGGDGSQGQGNPNDENPHRNRDS